MNRQSWRCQVSVVNGKSLSSIEYPVSSIELLNPQSTIRNVGNGTFLANYILSRIVGVNVRVVS